MVTQRRIGAESSKTRAMLIQATETLMQEEGYVAVSARRIAEQAGLKPQLVHYYFRTMDDLYMAVFDHVARRTRERQAQAMGAARPVTALWDMYNDSAIAAIIIEFLALANHRATLRDDIVRASEAFRAAQIEQLGEAMQREGFDTAAYPPLAIIMLMSTISTTLVLEANLGVAQGHAALRTLVRQHIERVESSARPA